MPESEAPLTAVRHAMASAVAQAPLSPFADRPLAGLWQAGQRPLLQLEAAVADGIATRLDAGAASQRDRTEFQVDVIARVAAAAFRSAVIQHRELRKSGDPALPGLLGHAFTIISEL